MTTQRTDLPCRPSFVPARSGGFSLVEMMVAMTIGLVLAGAGIAMYSNSRAAYTVNESVSRLQE
ncbi:MAG: PilW family protein, partial [Gammaproteobacteria bacterium]